MNADHVLELIARAVVDTPADPAVVAIDGPDAAGKTTLGDRLGAVVARSRPVVRVQADDFENVRSVRYQRGQSSPEGYFEDTYDLDALETKLLQPAARGLPIVLATYDWKSDSVLDELTVPVPPNGVVIVDGGFLLRERFRHYFHVTVLLVADEQERLRRAIPRQLGRLGSADAVVDRYRTRYFPGFELYLARENPAAHAQFVIDTTDFTAPVMTKRPG